MTFRIKPIITIICFFSLYSILVPQVCCSKKAERADRIPSSESELKQALQTAMRERDRKSVCKLALLMKAMLGERAGIPETPDKVLAPKPMSEVSLSRSELKKAYLPYLKQIARYRWWHIGLDPRLTPRLPREVASIINGCLIAHKLNLDGCNAALQEAIGGGDYLVWSQEQAGSGMIPFPAFRNGKTLPLKVAEKVFRKLEKEGTLDQYIHKGWLFKDPGEGGLQLDNGLCGIALFNLYETTHDQKYKKAALKASEWALKQDCVPNWNYNSFSVMLLSKAYKITQDKKYIDAAREKMFIGVLPGLLRDGKYRGRWADPHNAKPVYHYILVRSMVDLFSVLDTNNSDRSRLSRAIQLSFAARNKDFVEKGIINKNQALMALLAARKNLPKSISTSPELNIANALEVLAKRIVFEYNENGYPLEPGPWGAFLKYNSEKIDSSKVRSPIEKEIKGLNAIEFETKLTQDDSPQILDLRSPEAHSDYQFKGIILAPFRNAKFDRSCLDDLKYLSKSKPVFVYDHDGTLVRPAAKKLVDLGFKNVVVLNSGINTYSKMSPLIVNKAGKFWDTVYKSDRYVLGLEPNQFFIKNLKRKRPGRLLLPGEGEGRNAVAAAKLGWSVDAFDVSDEGRKKAINLARKNQVSLNYKIADLGKPELDKNEYDVVAVIDLPTFPETRKSGYASIKKCLKVGGIFIYDGFSDKNPLIKKGYPSRKELEDAFQGFKIHYLKEGKFTRKYAGKRQYQLLIRMVAEKVNG